MGSRVHTAAVVLSILMDTEARLGQCVHQSPFSLYAHNMHIHVHVHVSTSARNGEGREREREER